jgi:hypothetical protein
MRYLRIDDFPYGDRDCRPDIRCLGEIISIINSYKIPYILGVSPLLLNDYSFNYLKDNQFRCCMHGFEHGMCHWNEKKLDEGGEFAELEMVNIKELYHICDLIMRNFNYDPTHFIPPFNCYNQALLDVLNENKVKYIHSCSDCIKYNKNLNYGNVIPIISEWQSDGYAKDVDVNNPSQITLHWAFDVRDTDWKNDYKKLCEELIKIGI